MEENAVIEIRNEFKSHILNGDGVGRTADVAKLYSVFLNNLEAVVGTDGREMAIVRTKLQEAKMFTVLAVAVKPENQGS